ncbi:alpha/beta fold hydrolase [bacterium]|nr:alpha/beta fold hydrolase [bacterium]
MIKKAVCALVCIVVLVSFTGCITTFTPNQLMSGVSGQSEYYTQTDDGWTLALKRFNGGSSKPPVILCHGFNYNDRFYTLSNGVSLATWLASRGYDVWVVSLRGSGSSTKWVYKLGQRGLEGLDVYNAIDAENWIGAGLGGAELLWNLGRDQYKNVTINPKYMDWSLDDYANYDVPAVLKFVRQTTGHSKPFWIGHSMGGIIMLVHLIRQPDEPLQGLVTVGSQLTMEPGSVLVEYFAQMHALRLLQIGGNSDQLEMARREAEAAADRLFFNEENKNPMTAHTLHSIGTDTPGITVIGQYMELVGSGQLKSIRNEYNYAQNARNITVPYLIMCGAGDKLAPPPEQRFLYENISSADKELQILGMQYGFSSDFGHNDSLISDRAVAEVYPVIETWLQTHLTETSN